MALLTTQSIARAGLTPAYAAAAGGGDTFAPGTHTFLHAKNGAGVSQTVTIVTPRTDALGNAIADNAIAIPAGEERMIGPLPYEHYASPSTGVGNITYSAVVSLTIGVFAA